MSEKTKVSDEFLDRVTSGGIELVEGGQPAFDPEDFEDDEDESSDDEA